MSDSGDDVEVKFLKRKFFTKSLSREFHLSVKPKKKKRNEKSLSDVDPRLFFVLLTLISLLLWLCISQGDYSGYSKPKMFGDFEAQRHWSCVTLHLPFHEWYTNSSINDLEYWGLDYPPLTSFHMLLIGLTGRLFYPRLTPNECEKAKSETFNVDKSEDETCPSDIWSLESRGIQSYTLKFFIRIHTIVGYFLFFYCSMVIFGGYDLFLRDIGLAFLFLNPIPLLLIDFGHFQYNSISLGFFILSIYYYVKRDDKEYESEKANILCYIGSFFFILSLFYKIISLYYSLPTFFFCLFFNLKFEKKRFFTLSFLFISLFSLFFILPTVISLVNPLSTPLAYENDHSTLTKDNLILHLKQVIQRLFPFARGIYEDMVSNFWCSTNFVFRWKNRDIPTMKKLCLLFTLISCSFSFYRIIFPRLKSAESSSEADKVFTLRKKTTRDLRTVQRVKYLKSLVVTSFGFFFFSFHVHEKTILYPLIAWMLLNFYVLDERSRTSNPRVENKNNRSLKSILLNHYLMCSFSMFFLLRKDNLLLFYYLSGILMIMFFFDFRSLRVIKLYLTRKNEVRVPFVKVYKIVKNVMVICCLFLVHFFYHAGCLERLLVFRKLLVRYPFFWELLFSQISFAYFFFEIFGAVYILV